MRVALLDWLPLSLAEFAQDDEGHDEKPAAFRLAALVRPPTIWSLDDAADAALLFGRERPLERVPFAWLVAYALSRVEETHLRRVRARVARIVGELARPELAAAVSSVAHGCALIEHDGEACAAAAALALARYALSEVVAREAPALHLP